MTFKEITDDAMANLARLMAQLPALSDAHIYQGRDRSKAAVGTFDEILSRLKRALEADFDANTIETANAPWTFEYHASIGESAANELAVLTRLFHPQEKGAIYYGRYLRKHANGDYALWVED
jgi:hypothetical protein